MLHKNPVSKEQKTNKKVGAFILQSTSFKTENPRHIHRKDVCDLFIDHKDVCACAHMCAVCVHMGVHVYMVMCASVYVHVHMCAVCVYMCVYVCMCICSCALACVCMCMCVNSIVEEKTSI